MYDIEVVGGGNIVQIGPDGLRYTLDNNTTRIFREKIRGGITMLGSEGFPVSIFFTFCTKCSSFSVYLTDIVRYFIDLRSIFDYSRVSAKYVPVRVSILRLF